MNKQIFQDINKILNQEMICLNCGINKSTMYYVGFNNGYTYWSYNTIRALKFNLSFDIDEKLKFLQKHRGFVKCYKVEINQELETNVPAIFYKKLSYKIKRRKKIDEK